MSTMLTKWIDVWNVETFDDELLAELSTHATLVRGYITTVRKNFLEEEASDRRLPYPVNPYAGDFRGFVENEIMELMRARTVRAWHYSRLTDDEVERVRSSGVYPSTLQRIRDRLDAQVAAGVLSSEIAEALFAGSPFHGDRYASRSDKFWLTSNPIPIDDSGVAPLLENWGGESVYFSIKDASLQALVASIGRPRVLEVAIPMDSTQHIYPAAEAVVATFGRTLGCEPSWGAIDLYSNRALGPEAVITVHTDGEPNFIILARGYPVGFVGRAG